MSPSRPPRASLPRVRMAIDLEPTVTLPWLVRLRWLFLAGQLIVMPIAHLGFGVAIGWWALGVATGVTAISNLVIPRLPWQRARVMGGVLSLDIAMMTLLFAASGGATNPFTVFYLVHVTLAAVVLDARWTIALAALSMAGFGLLFALPAAADPHAGHVMTGGHAMQAMPGMNHLQGMWAAFALAAALIAFFVGRITRAIAVQREQIASLREASARNARLAALTTLAAGAAHELNNPLATIAVAAHEATIRIAKLAPNAPVADDLRLILLEVDRCQDILHQMAARAEQGDEAQRTTFDELARKIRDQLGEARVARIELRLDSAAELRVPSEQMAQSVVALIKNAIDASPPEARVVVTLAHDAADVRVSIEDLGGGIADDILGKIGEPFFTTKQPGHGLGLGVFLARAFFESRGGGLVIESTPGVGTTATARLPREVA